MLTPTTQLVATLGNAVLFFGEQNEAATCPGCDRCAIVEGDAPEISKAESDMIRKVLQGVARAGGRFGISLQQCSQALKRSALQQTDLPTLSTFGLLKTLGGTGCRELLQRLIDRGWCQLDGGSLSMYSYLNQRLGGSARQANRLLEYRVFLANDQKGDAIPSAARTTTPDTDDALATALRVFRRKQVEQSGAPAYTVFSGQGAPSHRHEAKRFKRAFCRLRGSDRPSGRNTDRASLPRSLGSRKMVRAVTWLELKALSKQAILDNQLIGCWSNHVRRTQTALLDEINDGIAIFCASPESIRNDDVHHDYRQDSDLYYLTGFEEPECVLILLPDPVRFTVQLCSQERDPQREIWDGYRLGVDDAPIKLGIDEAHSIVELDAQLTEILVGVRHVFYDLGRHDRE